MRVIRYAEDSRVVLAAVTDDNAVHPLPFTDFMDVVREAKHHHMSTFRYIQTFISGKQGIEKEMAELNLLVPIVAPEVWASGVTYEKSREARNYETSEKIAGQETCYDRVYHAERPEIFFKSTAARTVGPNDPIYLRSDSNWQIPEPEVGLVMTREGEIVGYTIGNDMSCRDIEGENPLYLPQAKIWKHSCAIGPAIRLAETVEDPYNLQMTCRIYRNDQLVVEESANTRQLKRKYDELVSFLIRDNEVFDGTVLLTGTCIVPPNQFTLQDGDRIDIEIPEIGVLSNPVKSLAQQAMANK
ncbi:fumarylacetoacetate hydrolase family protein [Geobacillus subterraneus]|uniref:fumarylacetoacetate hydrolase family protein n=1 Tax=Geobacillus subterraneus TaxID=129338 RepID=UPI001442B8D3|nr:fumarylacetoacetate hydrolase family protein [Geobacillus subterraneus]QIZ67977.1 fumarylacetoacetate hydrolase [Geobacillus subterraneus]WPZ16977.1 fumarylacetoacetate hydrolase family protein [Geobacillus subterraneus]